MSLLEKTLTSGVELLDGTLFDRDDNELVRAWKLLRSVPGGKKLFSMAIGFYVPYTGSISPRVQTVHDGFAEVAMADQRKVRNHLNSIHAVALANLIELTGNLALYSGMPPNGRFIVKELNVSYEKKARGRVVAESDTPTLDTTEEAEFEIDVTIRDSEGDVTTRGTLLTLVGPRN